MSVLVSKLSKGDVVRGRLKCNKDKRYKFRVVIKYNSGKHKDQWGFAIEDHKSWSGNILIPQEDIFIEEIVR